MIDQRQADRTPLEDTTVEVVDLESGVEFSGRAHDVSSGGLSFRAAMEPPVGADMKVKLSGGASLRGELHVTRVDQTASGFRVAGRLSKR
jgi:hypothetical protein